MDNQHQSNVPATINPQDFRSLDEDFRLFASPEPMLESEGSSPKEHEVELIDDELIDDTDDRKRSRRETFVYLPEEYTDVVDLEPIPLLPTTSIRPPLGVEVVDFNHPAPVSPASAYDPYYHADLAQSHYNSPLYPLPPVSPLPFYELNKPRNEYTPLYPPSPPMSPNPYVLRNDFNHPGATFTPFSSFVNSAPDPFGTYVDRSPSPFVAPYAPYTPYSSSYTPYTPYNSSYNPYTPYQYNMCSPYGSSIPPAPAISLPGTDYPYTSYPYVYTPSYGSTPSYTYTPTPPLNSYYPPSRPLTPNTLPDLPDLPSVFANNEAMGCGVETLTPPLGYSYSYPFSPTPYSPSPVVMDEKATQEQGMGVPVPVQDLGMDLNSRRALVKETRRRWIKDLLKAVSGYAFISLGIITFILGALYLYDADLQYSQYKKLEGSMEAFYIDLADMGCSAAESSQHCFAEAVSTSPVPQIHSYIYANALRPYTQIVLILACYTLSILVIGAWRTTRKILRCVKEGNAFVEEYLGYTEHMGYRRMKKDEPYADSQRYTGYPIQSYDPWSLTIDPTLPLHETLKPTHLKEWVGKALWIVLALHIPLTLLISVGLGSLPLLASGPTPGAYLRYAFGTTVYILVISACLYSVMKVTRQVVAPRQISGLMKAGANEFLEGTGRLYGETRVEVPWVCARMWNGMGLDWEDVGRVWRYGGGGYTRNHDYRV